MQPSCLPSAVKGMMERPSRLLSGDGVWGWGLCLCVCGGQRNRPFPGGSALGGGHEGGRDGGRGGVACLLCVAEDMSQSYKLTGD